MDRAAVALACSVTELDRGRADRAQRAVRAALDSAPGHAPLLTRAAELELLLGDHAAAEKTVVAAIRADSRSPEAWIVRALLCDALGRPESAVHYASYAAELAPFDPAAQLVLALVVERNPKRSRAMRARALRSLALAHNYAAPDSYLRESGAQTVLASFSGDGPDLPPLRTIRAWVGAEPEGPAALRSTAEYVWRALLTTVGWFWFWAALVLLTSLFTGSATVRVVGAVTLGALTTGCVQWLRRVGRRVPEGELRQRVRAPAAVLAFLVLLGGIALGFAGQALITVDRGATATTAGYLVVVTAAAAAGLAHVLVFVAWVRRDTGERTAQWDYALTRLPVAAVAAITAGGLLAAVYPWLSRPDAVWALGLLAGVVFIALCVEAATAFAADADRILRLVAVPILLLPAAGCAVLMDRVVRYLTG
ncbi:tetratricopeptide repeat protein [Nocardia sp. NPDC003345]